MTEQLMTDVDRSHLWMQRLFEAEAGMTQFLIDRRALHLLSAWMDVRVQIFANLPRLEAGASDSWRRAYFHAQALLERFIVEHYGHDALEEWARSNAVVHAGIEPDQTDARAPIRRIARQAELYGSGYEIVHSAPERASVVIRHCSIWDYRERARQRGVPITLESPCTYCTASMSANVRATGFSADYALFSHEDGHGCTWTATKGHSEHA